MSLTNRVDSQHFHNLRATKKIICFLAIVCWELVLMSFYISVAIFGIAIAVMCFFIGLGGSESDNDGW